MTPTHTPAAQPAFKSAADEARERLLADLAHWRERAAMTDADFLAEYCRDQRQQAVTQVAGIESSIKTDDEIAEQVRKYGEEG